jgi:pimeloyl-ACP methyl ester carboxylesterase
MFDTGFSSGEEISGVIAAFRQVWKNPLHIYDLDYRARATQRYADGGDDGSQSVPASNNRSPLECPVLCISIKASSWNMWAYIHLDFSDHNRLPLIARRVHDRSWPLGYLHQSQPV